MKINKAKLLAAIDAAEAAEVQKIEKYEAMKRIYVGRMRSEWRRTEQPRFRSLRDMLSKALRNNVYITSEMVNEAVGTRDRYSGLPTWHAPSVSSFDLDGKRYFKIVPQTARYAALRKTLEAIEDETVTPTALSSIGLKDIATLMRAAVE